MAAATETSASPPPLPHVIAPAKRLARRGAYAAIAEAAYVASQMVLVRIAPTFALTHDYYRDPFIVIEIAYLLLMAWGMYRFNRVLTVIHFVLSAFAPFTTFDETGDYWRALIPFVLFISFYAPALKGVRQYHRLRKTPPFSRPVRALFWSLAVLFVVGNIFLFVLLYQSPGMPDTATLANEDISQELHNYLVEKGVIDPDESILYAYFGGILSFAADGNLLTDRRAISYADLDGDAYYSAVPYEDIESVEIEEGSWLQDTFVILYANDGEETVLYFAAGNNLDRQACVYLLTRTEEADQ